MLANIFGILQTLHRHKTNIKFKKLAPCLKKKKNAYWVSNVFKIVEILNQYPQIINQKNISIVISGNRPDPKEYEYYPDFIYFDYQSLDPLVKQKMWNKIALISLNFKKFSNWNGKSRMTAKDYKKVDSVLRIAHQYGKPFRFWATPDTEVAWEAFHILGVNYINTDHPAQASNFFKKKIRYYLK